MRKAHARTAPRVGRVGTASRPRRPTPNGPEAPAPGRVAARVPARLRLGLVGDALDALDAIAPFHDAAEWDNVGLLAGRREWPARTALLAIDLTDAVADEALAAGTNLLVVYHPPIFKGIRSVTPGAESPTTRLPDLIAARTSIIALHTALDNAVGGTNEILLDPFEPVSREPLEPVVRGAEQFKLVAFVPAADVSRLRQALALAGAGVIGHYRECSFELAGRGTFVGDETTAPAIGVKQRLERVDEIRLEMVVPARNVGQAVRALYQNHPYEEPAFDLYPTTAVAGRGSVGAGRVGRLKRPIAGDAAVRTLRGHVDLACAAVVGDLRRRFTSITAAAGSFGVKSFRDPHSLVLTGEFKHHDALDLLKRGITAIHLDHSASERPALRVVAERLRKLVPGMKLSISRRDRSPFVRL